MLGGEALARVNGFPCDDTFSFESATGLLDTIYYNKKKIRDQLLQQLVHYDLPTTSASSFQEFMTVLSFKL